MELLDEEELFKKGNNKNKKVIINLIIIMSVLLLIITALMFVIPKQKKVYKEEFKINESLIEDTFIINNEEDNKKYISIKEIDNLMNYTYYKNEKEELYINNNFETITFEIDSEVITKKEVDSVIEKQNYELKNKIIEKNDKEYICLDDLRNFYKCNIFI